MGLGLISAEHKFNIDPRHQVFCQSQFLQSADSTPQIVPVWAESFARDELRTGLLDYDPLTVELMPDYWYYLLFFFHRDLLQWFDYQIALVLL
jgi:hypothetical protein